MELEPNEAVVEATRIMTDFATRTGVSGDRRPKRYLWTDAFAVCNFLGLHEQTGNQEHLATALALVDQVHDVLGSFRQDDPRRGPLSGLEADEARWHPTVGGLRIGKPVAERGANASFDERLEWERDGQYFHYLTKWMVALDQTARITGEVRYNVWARELAQTARDAFVYQVSGRPRYAMVWKMSTDLSRPLVTSMGQHDPLDGFVTCLQLRLTAQEMSSSRGPGLDESMATYGQLIDHVYPTNDPLGIGGLLADAARLAQIESAAESRSNPDQATGWSPDDLDAAQGLAARMVQAAAAGLADYVRSGDLHRSAHERLPFRELGLAIGLKAVELTLVRDRGTNGQRAISKALTPLEAFSALGSDILSLWTAPDRRRSTTWQAHMDINDVMLATALAPTGFVELARIGGSGREESL